MAGLTIWEQRALAGKNKVPPEAGYTKVFYGCRNSEDIERANSEDNFFIYWDNKSLNRIFKFAYGLKFWVGRFSGQALPSPLWHLRECRLYGLINTTKEKKSKIKRNSKVKNENSGGSFFKIIQRIAYLIWAAPLADFIQRVGKLLWATLPVMIFDSFGHSFSNENDESNKEISKISRVLGINATNRSRHSSLNRHTLPRDGLAYLLFMITVMVLFIAVSLFSEHVFNLRNYLIQQVRTAYGVTDFWSELWTYLNLPGNSPLSNNDIHIVLFLSFIIWIVIGLFELSLFLLSIGISLKIVFRLRESRFAESACVLESLRTLIELEREDALNSPLQKNYLMIRMNYLSSMSLIIPDNYLRGCLINRSVSKKAHSP